MRSDPIARIIESRNIGRNFKAIGKINGGKSVFKSFASYKAIEIPSICRHSLLTIALCACQGFKRLGKLG